MDPRENIDYTNYYQIRIIPTDDKEDVNPTHPIFDNLFEVYALTFRDFLDYLQVFNDTRQWNDYTPDDHARYPNVHLHCNKALTAANKTTALKILHGSPCYHVVIYRPNTHGRPVIKNHKTCIINIPHMVDPIQDITMDTNKYSLMVALMLLRQLYAVLYPEKYNRAVFLRQSPFVFHNSDIQHLYYDIDEWGCMIESHIIREGLDIDNTTNNKQLRLAEIVYSFAANNSINVSEEDVLIPEIVPTHFLSIQEYLSEKAIKTVKYSERAEAEYRAFISRHNAEMALIAGNLRAAAAAIANVPVTLHPVPVPAEALRVGYVPADDDDDDDNNLDLPPLIGRSPHAPTFAQAVRNSFI